MALETRSRSSLRRGSCPGVYTPMVSGDGLLVRVRAAARALTSAELRTLAALAARHGNGQLELTRRANIQLRGVGERELAPLQAALVAAGLADADPLRERRLARLLVDPWAPPLGLEQALAECADAGPISDKFAIAHDGAGGSLADVEADIRVQVRAGLAHLTLAGTGPIGSCLPERAAALVCTLMNQVGAHPSALRMRELRPALPELAASPSWNQEPPELLGPGAPYFGVALPFGAADADSLLALARLLDEHGDGTLRVTARRVLLLSGVPASAHQALRAAGLIVDARDPLHRVVACPGAPACGSALGDTRTLGRALARAGSGRVHVSGCEKGCAHGGPAAITVVCAPEGLRLGFDSDVAAVALTPPMGRAELNSRLAARASDVRVRPPMTRKYDYVREGAEIYRRSFAIIRSEAQLARFSEREERVAVRLIHTCGMVDLADDIVFSEGFVEAAQAALRAGAPVLCDANMIVSGVTRARLSANNELLCFLDQPGLAALARELRTTRSAAALEHWRARLSGALVAIGNAPTALFRLLELFDEMDARPAAVIGLPVGFVGAAESKQALLADGRVPAMVVRGRRGGSAMTVAAINALASDEE
jgi:precorrin isomerase